MATTVLVVDTVDAASLAPGRDAASALSAATLEVDATVVVAALGVPDSLRALAEAAAAGGGDLVVADAALVAHATPVADVVQDPRHGCATLVADVAGQRGAVVSGGLVVDVVSGGSVALAGLLRVGRPDREAATGAWHAAAADVERGGPLRGFAEGAVLDLALLALVRAGVRVMSVRPTPFVARRLGDADTGRTAEVAAALDAVDEPYARLRRASRPRDGFYSTFAVRPVSRRVTAIALSRGWTPNVITVWSLVVGLAAAACFATGDRGGLVVGAVLLQVSLVIDCVDGEVARYTRRFSALGAWLDAVFDRVKELVVYAALAVGSLRHGDDVWVLAVAALALLVVRHTVDFGFAVRHGDLTYVEIVQRPLREGAPSTYTVATGVTATPARPTDEVTGMAWARRVVILPIGERWLVISVLAALSGARAVFAALLVLGLVAALYTTAGRVRRTLGNRAPLREAASAHLRELVDLEPAGEALLSGPLAGLVAGRAGWLLPALARLSEFGVVTLLVARGLLPGGPAYLLLAAIAYHHYDTVYRQRQIGHAASMTTRSLLLGTDGRLLAVLVIAALAQEQALPVLVLAAWMAVVTVVESVRSWTSWLRAGAQAVAEDGMVA